MFRLEDWALLLVQDKEAIAKARWTEKGCLECQKCERQIIIFYIIWSSDLFQLIPNPFNWALTHSTRPQSVKGQL